MKFVTTLAGVIFTTSGSEIAREQVIVGIKGQREGTADIRSENRFRSVRGDFVDRVTHVRSSEQFSL